MAVAAILAVAIAPIAIRSVEVKAGEKTALEIVHLQDIGRKFYIEHGKAWPQSFDALRQGGYVNPQWDGLNPWGAAYLFSGAPGLFFVSTDVPQNVSGLVAARVPMASVLGRTVTSSVALYDTTAGAIEPGVIVAWSGAIADIPSGWALCDGSNGTPDLRDKFIVGARQDDQGAAKTGILGPLSTTGGTITHNHGGVTGDHVLTIAEIPPHSHSMAVNDKRTDGGALYPEMVPIHSTMTIQTEATGGGRGHTHTVATDYHVPPYYALAFIMKLP